MKLTSPAFKNKGEIPKIHALNYGNKCPGFEISNITGKAESLVLIVDDPDAKKVPKKLGGQGKIWVHWTVWDIIPFADNAESEEYDMKDNITIPSFTPDKDRIALKDAVEGITSFQRTGYDGPAPPDKEHTYRFSIYALDTKLSLDSKATKTDLMKAMKGHILDQDTLLGTFEDPELRKKREANDKK